MFISGVKAEMADLITSSESDPAKAGKHSQTQGEAAMSLTIEFCPLSQQELSLSSP